MKDTETIQTLKTLLCLINNSESHYIEISAETLERTLDLINSQKAENEKLKEASKEAVSCFHRMESLYNIKCMELKVAKAEAIKEVVGKTQAFLAIKCRGVVEYNPNLDEILWGYRKEDVDEFFDNLVKEKNEVGM